MIVFNYYQEYIHAEAYNHIYEAVRITLCIEALILTSSSLASPYIEPAYLCPSTIVSLG